MKPSVAGHLCAALWLDSGTSPRTLRGCGRDRGYLGTGDQFDRAMATFADTYADQNERDYAALKHAVDSGKIPAELA